MHLNTGCCPELFCCLEIDQEIILVQLCETPHEGLRNAELSKLQPSVGFYID